MICKQNFRAFYGWLAHCRHLRTVRQHLSGLTFHEPTSTQNCEWSKGLQEEYWHGYLDLIEQQSLKVKGTQNITKGSSCRSRPLEIILPVKQEEQHRLADTRKEVNKGQCNDSDDNSKVITGDKEDGLFNINEIYWRIYFGGIEASIRAQVTLLLPITNYAVRHWR